MFNRKKISELVINYTKEVSLQNQLIETYNNTLQSAVSNLEKIVTIDYKLTYADVDDKLEKLEEKKQYFEFFKNEKKKLDNTEVEIKKNVVKITNIENEFNKNQLNKLKKNNPVKKQIEPCDILSNIYRVKYKVEDSYFSQNAGIETFNNDYIIKFYENFIERFEIEFNVNYHEYIETIEKEEELVFPRFKGGAELGK